MSVGHLWIKMCNFHHNVLTVEDLPVSNTANCVLLMCWKNILCSSQQGMKCLLAVDITFLVFLCCQRLLMEKALREQRQAERRCWDEGNYGGLSRERKAFISTVGIPPVIRLHQVKDMCAGKSNFVSDTEYIYIFLITMSL